MTGALVHDAAADADKIVLRPLGQPAEGLPIGKPVLRGLVTGHRLDQDSNAHFQGGGGGQAVAGDIAANGDIQSRQFHAQGPVLDKNALDIVAPDRRLLPLHGGIRIEFDNTGLVEGDHAHGAGRVRPDRNIGAELDGGGHHQAAAVVDVLADQVHPGGGKKETLIGAAAAKGFRQGFLDPVDQ